ncbi:MAG: bifunctional oligoribonuclease/PAP phosphatase NrnA [Spirochaetes bacterium]|nr:MAG: bifunctional oligoribonuclease/PAP phosphatase NrnA [Spirochaetota bacterium]
MVLFKKETMKTQIPAELLESIREYDSFIIIGHKEPDGDTLSSQLALTSFLNRKGKHAVPVSPGPFDRKEIAEKEKLFLRHIPETTVKESSLIVVLDCSTIDRIGYLAQEVEGYRIAVVDHHSSGQVFGDVRYIDPKAPSVTYMIQKIIEEMGDAPNSAEAELLLFGLATDTGFFRHLETGTGHVFKSVSRLVDAGASPKEVFSEMYGNRSLESRILLGKLLMNAESLCSGRLIFVVETKDDVSRFGKNSRDSDFLYQLLTGVDTVETVALLRYESETEISVGLRSSGTVDVGAVAKKFGGGGHKKAAGFSSGSSFSEIKKELLNILCS